MSAPEKRLIRSKSGLRILPIKESKRSPFELSEPEWMKDCQSSACANCNERFDFVRRRHHCRRCGQIFCNRCCKNLMPLPRMCFLDPVRVCVSCERITLEEESFYNNDLKALIKGDLLEVHHVCPDPIYEFQFRKSLASAVLHCSLSADHCLLLLTGSVTQTIPIAHIRILANLMNEDIHNRALNKLSILVQDINHAMEFVVPPDCSDSSSEFLWSLYKALQMSEEARSIVGTGN